VTKGGRPVVHQIPLCPAQLQTFASLIGPDRSARLLALATHLHRRIGDRVVWNVNSTAFGGGVAEMLSVDLAYVEATGVDGRWAVIAGEPDFFVLTKRLHNKIHGSPGDGGPLGPEEKNIYDRVSARNAEELRARIRPGDIVLLHDPQTAGLVAPLLQAGGLVVWRCHVGVDEDNEHTEQAWDFLRPYIEPATAVVFSRPGYAPDWVDRRRLVVIPPAIDPLSIKNRDMEPDLVHSVLAAAEILDVPSPRLRPEFHRDDGRPDLVRRPVLAVREGPLPTPDVPVVLQVSRWDRLKDMPGVLAGFVDGAADTGAHLILAGPDVSGVTDDPEGQEVLEECAKLWHSLSAQQRRQVTLASLPMVDAMENAWIVNALQRHAHVVTQKSVAEGFGLTVSEAMFKGRPVIAGQVGGICDQIVSGQSGVLLEDPLDLAAFGAVTRSLLVDPLLARRLGEAGRQRVVTHFLPDRQLSQWGELLLKLGV
jgi:trehalose synthase